MNNKRKFIYLLSSACIAFQAGAVEEIEHLKPQNIAQDTNSVDLLSGKFYPDFPGLSIPAAPRLSV